MKNTDTVNNAPCVEERSTFLSIFHFFSKNTPDFISCLRACRPPACQYNTMCVRQRVARVHLRQRIAVLTACRRRWWAQSVTKGRRRRLMIGVVDWRRSTTEWDGSLHGRWTWRDDASPLTVAAPAILYWITYIRRLDSRESPHSLYPSFSFLSFVWCPLSVFCLFLIVVIIIRICSGDQLWWSIPSGSLPLYCFSLQLLCVIVVNKISIYLCHSQNILRRMQGFSQVEFTCKIVESSEIVFVH